MDCSVDFTIEYFSFVEGTDNLSFDLTAKTSCIGLVYFVVIVSCLVVESFVPDLVS